MTVSTIKMTAEQYKQLGEDPPGVRLELVDGEVAVSPSPAPRHSWAVTELMFLLRSHIGDGTRGVLFADVDTVFGTHDVRRPDILFYAKARANLVSGDRLRGRPDLAVEVVSPGSERIDKEDKFLQYAKGGIKHYWIVDPEQKTFEAYTLKGGRYRLTTRGQDADVVQAEPFADLAVPLKKLWWRG